MTTWPRGSEDEPARWPATVVHLDMEADPLDDILDTCATGLNLLLALPAAGALDHGQRLMVERVVDLMVQVAEELRG